MKILGYSRLIPNIQEISNALENIETKTQQWTKDKYIKYKIIYEIFNTVHEISNGFHCQVLQKSRIFKNSSEYTRNK